MKTRFILTLTVLVIAGGIGSMVIVNHTFKTTLPHLGPVSQAVYATGIVEPVAEVPISFETTGILKNLWVDEGHGVTKNQPLAALDHDDLKATIEQSKVDVALSKEELNRKQTLWKKGAGSYEQYDTAKATYERSLYSLQTNQAKLDYYILYAPEKGTITKRDGEIGQILKPENIVLWFAPDTLRITAEVDEENMPKVHIGQKVHLRAPAFPDDLFEGTVQAITPKGDAIQRTFRVRLTMDEPHPDVRIGMTIEANIIVRETEKAILVPSSAVVQNSVWMIKDNKLVKRQVKLGTQGVKETEIIKGLDLKEAIIKEPLPTFKEGQWALEF